MQLLIASLSITVAVEAQSTSLDSQALVPLRVLALQGKTAHVQGIDTEGVTLWVTAVDRTQRKGYLQTFSVADGRLQNTIEVQDGDRFDPGGIAADANSIWVPLAEYKANSTTWIQQRNELTLELEFQFAVQDHIGCVAVTPDFIIGGNWDSKDFYVWDHKGTLIRKVASSTDNSYQDLKVRDGFLIASGVLPGGQGAVDWLDLTSLKMNRRLQVGKTDSGGPLTREGMTVFGNQLWLLPEDGNSRLFSFRLP